MIQFNMTATATVSGIKPEFENRINKAVLAEYLARLNEIRTGTIRAAVLASPGVSWTSGKSLPVRSSNVDHVTSHPFSHTISKIV